MDTGSSKLSEPRGFFSESTPPFGVDCSSLDFVASLGRTITTATYLQVVQAKLVQIASLDGLSIRSTERMFDSRAKSSPNLMQLGNQHQENDHFHTYWAY